MHTTISCTNHAPIMRQSCTSQYGQACTNHAPITISTSTHPVLTSMRITIWTSMHHPCRSLYHAPSMHQSCTTQYGQACTIHAHHNIMHQSCTNQDIDKHAPCVDLRAHHSMDEHQSSSRPASCSTSHICVSHAQRAHARYLSDAILHNFSH